LATHKDLARKLEQLEAKQKHHTSIITVVVEEIKKLREPPPSPPKRRIGFTTPGVKGPTRSSSQVACTSLYSAKSALLLLQSRLV
jgi:hypothetical protein